MDETSDGDSESGFIFGGRVMAVIFAIILIVAVAIPITTDVITEANLTGITASVIGFIPLFLGLAGFAVAAALVGGGFTGSYFDEDDEEYDEDDEPYPDEDVVILQEPNLDEPVLDEVPKKLKKFDKKRYVKDINHDYRKTLSEDNTQETQDTTLEV